MACQALRRAIPALLAIVQAVSSTPTLAFGSGFDTSNDLMLRNASPEPQASSGGVTVWPQDIAMDAHDQSWSNFTAETSRWSTFVPPTFNEVFLPSTEKELSEGLEFMSSKGLKFLARSGGHGYSSTLQSIQQGVLVNLRKLNKVTVQPDDLAVAGTGALFQDLINAVGSAKRELNVGSCGCVGSTGAMLGGGLGRFQGLYGLTSDAVRKVRVALWNGTMIEASPQKNQDLWYGIRGSGQNYGIVTETTYQTWPATNGGQYYNADLVFTKDKMLHIVSIINALSYPALDSKLAILTFLASDAKTSKLEIIVNIVYVGSKAQGQKYTNLFRGFAVSTAESMLSFAELPTKTVLGLIPGACAEGPRYNLYSAITRNLEPKTFVNFANEFEKFMQDNPLANNSALQIESFPTQGVEALPEDYSAFPHRKAFRNQIESIGTYVDDKVASAVDNFFKKWRNTFASPAVAGYPDIHTYQNYAHGDEPLSQIYGKEEWRHKRLTDLKNKYDPHGYFNAYHAPPSKLSDWE